MSKGVLLFAYNNSDIDYIELAVISANRIKLHLNLPVSIVVDTDSLTDPRLKIFDKVIESSSNISQKKRFYDGMDYKMLEWKNF